MGIKFDGSTDYYTITRASSLELGNGDWTYGLWLKLDDTSGTGFEIIYSSVNTTPNSNDIHMRYYQDSHATLANQINIRHRDTFSNPYASSDNFNFAHPSDNAWHLIVMTQTGSDGEVFVAPAGGAAVSKRSGTRNLDVTTLDDDLYIGTDPGVTDLFGNYMAEFFWMKNQTLTQDEVTAMAAGMTIFDLGYFPDVYIPMTEDAATLNDLANTQDMARNGTPITADHPPILQRKPIYVTTATAGVGGGSNLPIGSLNLLGAGA